MRLFFESLAVAFSMYSRLPMPQFEWGEKNLRWSLAFLPVVGAVLAAVMYAALCLFRFFGLGGVFFAAAAVLIPVLFTGGIHLDGFCDTCDALASHAGREKRLEIMKDPHVGAFGVIYTCSLLIFQFGAWFRVYEKPGILFCVLAAMVVSRALSALAIINLPKARGTGLAATFSEYAQKKPATAILAALAAFCLILPAIFLGPVAAVPAAAELAAFFIFTLWAKKRFGGITGDLAGFFISLCEALALAVCAVLG